MKIIAAQTVAKNRLSGLRFKRKDQESQQQRGKDHQLDAHAPFAPFAKLRAAHTGADLLLGQDIGELHAGDGVFVLLVGALGHDLRVAAVPLDGLLLLFILQKFRFGGLNPWGSGGWAVSSFSFVKSFM